MEGLSFDNIMVADEVDTLFEEPATEEKPQNDKTEPDAGEQGKGQSDDKTTTPSADGQQTKVNPDELFDGQESVGKGDKQEKGDTKSDDVGTSSKFYSSIAKAFAEEGIFPDLDDKTLESIKTPEDLKEIVQKAIDSRFDEETKKIKDALEGGVEPQDIKKYEGTLKYLGSIKETDITDESDKGETLRRQLIYQDFINRGFSQERAQREVKRSFDSGSDVDDAKEALQSNKDFFKDQYDDILKEAQQEREKYQREQKKNAEKLRETILNDENAFGGFKVSAEDRKKAYDNLTKPVYKDPDSGQQLTALQKYERDHREDFLKNVAVIYTLTDGFKTLEKLVGAKANEVKKKGLRELEHAINNTSRTTDGSLNFSSGVGDGFKLGKNFDLDI